MTLLEQLAELYGIQTSYYDMAGRRIPASAEAMLAVLRLLEAPVETLEDVPSALSERQEYIWRQVIEPVVIIWDDEPPAIKIRLPASLDASLHGYLKLESGEESEFTCNIAELTILEHKELGQSHYVIKQLQLPHGLPWGYHRLCFELGGKSWESLLIVSPRRAYSLPGDKVWGVFLPLYALHTRRSWGAGDFSDLCELIDLISGMGGGMVATLPFLASFFNHALPSPYTPASRLFWNEFYVDVRQTPEYEQCPDARTLVDSTAFQQEVQALNSLPLVDYSRQMSLKRKALEELAHCFFDRESERTADFQRFLASNKAVEDYARFRAAGEQSGISWTEWREPARSGVLQPGDYAETSRQYHLYAQWVASKQVDSVSRKAKQTGPGLYLDLPLGVHPHSYDVWRQRDVFVCQTSTGAPPDPVFTSGQNWGFPPLHPEKLRLQGYRYLIDCLRHQLSLAGILRIDHVMSYHRLFWIPQGMENSQGLYVRYHPEEYYAILTLESRRNKAIIVGEDLGLVPPEVRTAMAEHGLYRMYIPQYELTAEQHALREVPAESVASLNTHDMFPFAAFWQEMDIPERRKLGLVDEKLAQQEAEHRRRQKSALVSLLQSKNMVKEANPEAESVLSAMLNFMSASPARAVLINLEDLWLETQPQNIPGTWGAESWRRKARYSLEEFSQLPQVMSALNAVNSIRKKG